MPWNAANARVAASGLATAAVRHQRWVPKWLAFSTQPLRLPRRGRQIASSTPQCFATGAKLASTRPVPTTTTMLMRSKRHRRAVPPNCRSTTSIAAIRCGWSSASANTPRVCPE